MAFGAPHIVAYLLALALAIWACLAAASGSPSVVPAVLTAVGLLTALVLGSAILAHAVRREWPRILLVLLTGIGLTLAGLLVSLTRESAEAGGLIERVCRPGGQANLCQQAFQSRWAGLPLGFGPEPPRIPAVVVAVAFYSFLLVWFLVVGEPTEAQRRWHMIPLCLTTAAVVVAVYLTVIMYTKLAGACPLCLVSHVVTGLVFVVTLLAWPRTAPVKTGVERVGGVAGNSATSAPVGEVPAWHRPATALVLGGAVALLGVQSRTNKALQGRAKQFEFAYGQFANDPEFMRWDFNRQPVVDWAIRPDDSVRGDEGAPFVLITYSDFQCPQCYALARTLKQVEAKFPGRLRVVFRHFPLDHSCNPVTTTYMHAFSCQAARAAEAARILGGERAFWKMHDLLFEHRGELDTQPYVKLAGMAGLRAAQFKAEMARPSSLDRVRAQAEGSKKFPVATTPSVFLNGRRIQRWQSMAFWEAVLTAPASQPTPAQATKR